MAEVINTNVFDAEKKFVDFAGLDYFWEKAKKYVDDADKVTADKVATLEGVVGNDASGLVKDLADLKATVDALGDIEGGEGLGGMIDAKIGALDVEDVAVEGQYVSSVAEVDGKVVVTRANLPVYEEVGVAKDFNDAMDKRVKVLEAIDHEKLAADASAAAVATVLDGAPEKFDTLKEVAQWIADSESAATAADLVTRVATLEAIDHDAYVEADKTVLSDAKTYAEGLVMVDGVAKFDAAGSATTAEQNAKDYADGKFQVAGDYEAVGVAAGLVDGLANGAVKTNTDAIAVINGNAETEGSIAKAKADAIAQAKADAAETLKGYYTKDEVDGFVDAVNGNIESAQAAAESYAKTYTDALFTSFKFAGNSDIDALFAPKTEA
jgi:hypothetical protein